jgi:hypothetical protein
MARIIRVAPTLGVAVPVVLVIVAILVLPGYVPLVPREIRRHVTEGFLRGLLAAYFGVAVFAVLGTFALAARVIRGRNRGLRRTRSARGLLLAVACLLGLVLVESGATAWRAWAHRMPRLPTRFAEVSRQGQERDIQIVVIGGSSALGHPYDPWLSVGQIVAWQLHKDVPDRGYSVEILAKLGASLEDMHKRLANLSRRPDALIIYSGHNEFVARFEEERDPWLDEEPRSAWVHPFYRASLHSALCRMVYETISKNRLDGPPPRINRHHLIEPPQCSPSEADEVLANFRRRLEAIVAYCDRIGTLPILIIPPSNEGGLEPSRSVLPATASAAERRWVVETFQAARAVEGSDPARCRALYRSIIDREPGFAEARFRLGRLLETSGQYDEASRQYIAARDADGLPIRCTTVFQDVYREVAARHPRAILIDGPAVLRDASPHHILDDHMIQDAHHPTLSGASALAEAVVRALRQRQALGARTGNLAAIEPADCARHFGIGPEKWAKVCERASVHYRRISGYRYDPAERLAKADLYAEAIPRILAGAAPGSLGIVGLGITQP